MPRKTRMYLPGIPCHIIQRGNDRQACFFAPADYQLYLTQLHDACCRYKVSLHAYVLMTNHTHLIMTPTDVIGISRVMQSLGSSYVQTFNKIYQRSGTLWESRHKSNLIDADNYLLSCYRYIELNPVRAKMVEQPADYFWSSYKAHAYGEANKHLTNHQTFLALHTTAKKRQDIYRDLFSAPLPKALVQEIRNASTFSLPLGSSAFKVRVKEKLGRGAANSISPKPKKIKS